MKELVERIESMCFPEPNTGCLLFGGRTSKKGYPLISWRGRDVRAHRAMLADKLGLELEELDSSIFACHSCDQRCCCEPAHLFPGTNQQNVEDKCRKGRQARVHGRRKLDRRQVAGIRRSRAAGVPVRVIAERKGLSERQVERIVAGTRWAS